jgi:acetolactate synthase-1/2/3 large subunit
MRGCLDRDAIITTDVGNFFFWTIFFMEVYHPGTLVCSSSFSVMGCGLPLAVGAKLAKPERQVVCLAGDGGFLMNNQELATAIENELAIPVIIMNDSGYGAVRHIQDRACKGRYIASTWTSPDFVQMAKSFGADGALVEKPQDIAPAMKAALTSDKPTVLDIRVDGNEKLPQDRLPRES